MAGTKLELETDIARTLKGSSQAFKQYAKFSETFGKPERDEILLIAAQDLGTDRAFNGLEDLVFEIALSPGVAAVVSIFSVPDPDGRAPSFLSRADIAQLPEWERLERLRATAPITESLLSADRRLTLLSVIPDNSTASEVFLTAIKSAAATVQTELDVTFIGVPALEREITRALIQDQLALAHVALATVLLLLLAFLGSWRAALTCLIPGLCGITWMLAILPALGIAFHPLLALIPTLLVVLGLADAIHLLHAISRARQSKEARAAVLQGVAETLPPIFLTSVTTGLAFASLLAVGVPTITELAIVGILGLFTMLLAVILLTPLLYLVLFHRQDKICVSFRYESIRVAAVGFMHWRNGTTGLAMMLGAGLIYAQTKTEIGFSLMDYLPENSEFRATMNNVDAALGGSDRLFAVVARAEPGQTVSQVDRERFSLASAGLYGPEQEWLKIDTIDPHVNVAASRVVSRDGSAFAFALPATFGDSWKETRKAGQNALSKLATVGLREESYVTSFTLMAGEEVPAIVKALRSSFYVAVAGVAVLMVVFLGSVSLATISLVPCLMPILSVEAWLVVLDQPLTLTGAIALTIAFGIAVDDTIHVLNRLKIEAKPAGVLDRASLSRALNAIVPPVVTTTIVLVAGLSLSILSALPGLSMFGQLASLAIALALFTNLFIFPGLVLFFSNWEAK